MKADALTDLRDDLVPLWKRITLAPATEGARTVMLVSAHPGEGTTSAAVSLALLAAARVQRTAWLVDLDMRSNRAFEALMSTPFRRVGPPGQAYDGSFGVAAPYRLTDAGGAAIAAEPSSRLLAAHRVGETRLMVTRLRTEKLGPGQRVSVTDAPGWWSALRRGVDWAVVDAPAFSQTRAALAACRHVDGVVIVSRSDLSDASDVLAVRADIEAGGGRVLGVLANAVRSDARVFDRLFHG
jgi:hypothetical protein